MALLELSSSVPMSCRSEFIPLGSPLEGRNSEWNEPPPVQAVCLNQDRHLLASPGTASTLLALLSRAESPFCHHRLQEIRKIKLAIGPPGSPGQPGEPGVRLSTQQELLAPYSYSEYWSHFLLTLLPFSIFGDCFRERRTNDLRLQKYLKVSRRFLYCLKPSDWDWSCPCIYSLGCPFTHHLLFTVPLGFFSLALDDMKHRTEELIHVKTFFPPPFFKLCFNPVLVAALFCHYYTDNLCHQKEGMIQERRGWYKLGLT